MRNEEIMLAVLTLDLKTLKYGAIAILLGISIFQLVVPMFMELLKGAATTKPNPISLIGKKRSSDQPPPAGFVEHLKLIEEASPNANAEIRWKYATEGLTEAQVALTEAKLARRVEDPKTKGKS